MYTVQLNFSRDGNAGAPYSSIELIEAGFGQTDPTVKVSQANPGQLMFSHSGCKQKQK